MIEILAPVGGDEQLKAAVRCGADAVYFGMGNFNARRNADNFSDENLAQVIKYCHDREVKVYITINTIVKPSELADMKRAVDLAIDAGADSLIVQDMAVFSYAKGRIHLAASTQMAVHNVAGAKLAKEMGFDRVVLARELSLKEIAEINSKVDVETEVFVHGAHCMSVSGNCYVSSMIGGRSGNRGLCAQTCRLGWKCEGSEYCLSLKDLSYMTHIAQLIDAGVSSFKIEGRMKRPEYVAASVTALKDAIAGREPDMKTLQSVFSRSGFTDGYLTGKRDSSMFGHRTKEDVVAADGVLKDLAKLYERETYQRPVDMTLVVKEGVPAKLTCVSGDRKSSVTGPVPEKAIKMPIDFEYAKKSLSKTGGTVYVLDKLVCDIDEGLMLPASALNAMRREALDAL